MNAPILLASVDLHACSTCNKLMKAALDKEFAKNMGKLCDHVYDKHDDLSTRLSHKMLEAYNERTDRANAVRVTLEDT